MPAAKPLASGLALLTAVVPIAACALFRLASLATIKTLLRFRLIAPPVYHPDSLDKARVTAALVSKGILLQGECVVGLGFEQMEKGGIGDVRRVVLEYSLKADRAAELPLPPPSMVMKFLGTEWKDAFIGALIPLVETEHKAYTDACFSKMVHGLQPEVYLFDKSVFGMGLLLMEDLSKYRHKKSRDGANHEELLMIANLIGRIHGKTLMSSSDRRSEALQAKFHFHQWFIDQMCPIHSDKNLTGPWAGAVQKNRRVATAIRSFQEKEVNDALLVKMRGFGVAVKNGENMYPTPFSVVIHGDVRLDNCFFDDVRKEAKLVDWQVCMPRNPMLEFGWVLMECNDDVLCLPTTEGEGERTKCKAGCKASIDELLLGYLTSLTQELKLSGYKGEFPTLAFCEENLPWVIYNDCYYLMVTLAQVLKVDPLTSPTDPVVLTFQKYLERVEWLMEVYVPSGRMV